MGIFWEEKVYVSKRTYGRRVGQDNETPAEPRQPRARREAPPPRVVEPFVWPNPYMLDNFPTLSGFVALDFETKDPGLANGGGSSWPFMGEGFICGAAVSVRNRLLDTTFDYYLPIAHSEGNTDADRFWEWLRHAANDPNVTFVMANSIYDLGWLNRHGIDPVNAPYDVQAMATLLDEHRFSYSLDNLAQLYLNENKSTDEFVARCQRGGVDRPFENMDKIPSWIVAPYGKRDAQLTLRLFNHLSPLIVQENLTNVLDLERECTKVAVDMRARGVRVDLGKAEQIKVEFTQRQASAIERIKQATGINVEPFDNAAIANALRVENPALELAKTSTGKDSIRAGALERMDTPVSRDVREMRQMAKLISTFIDGYLLEHSRKGRVHAEFHPLRRVDEEGAKGTISGRFASSNPNLQNIPNRTDEGRRIREAFVPEEDEDWCKLDYASQEPRLTVHFASLANLRGAAEMVARYNENPMTDLHGETATLMNVPRWKAKAINLGIAYGLGGAGLCKQLGLPTQFVERYGRKVEIAGDEGQRLLDAHARGTPFISELFKMTRDAAKRRGWIRTIEGRVLHFEKNDKGEFDWIHAACNRLIQGSAADQMKRALVNLRAAGIPILITVHDEADLSVPKGEVGARVIAQCKEIMENALRLAVPVVADVKTGENWAAIE